MKWVRVCLIAVMAALAACSPSDSPSSETSGEHAPVSAWIDRADNRFLQGDFFGARKFLWTELKEDPDSFHAWYRLGVLGVWEDSLRAGRQLDRAQELAPHHPGPPNWRGHMFSKASNPEDAAVWYRKAETLVRARAVGYPDTTQELGALIPALLAKRPREVVEPLAELAKADTTNGALWALYGKTVFQAGDPYTGEEILSRALSIDPHNQLALSYKGICLYRLSRRNEAMSMADSVLSMNPRHPISLYLKGQVLRDQSEFREGFLYQWRALLENPQEPQLYQHLGSAMMRQGDQAMGIAFLTMMDWTINFRHGEFGR